MATQTISRTITSSDDQPRQEVNLPTFETIKKAVPEHCFERSLPKSLFFFGFDVCVLALLYVAVPYFEGVGIAGLFAWYWVVGMFGSSLFCIGHDCGHGTFSDYLWVNDLVGHLAHAPILAPYWPWKKSHRQHHQYTSHIDKDKGHPWVTEEEFNDRHWLKTLFAKLPISGFFRWQPIYTVLGLPDGSHFWPFSKLFTNNRERIQCVISGGACLFCAWIALRMCDYSCYNFVKYYYIPCLFQGFWLIVITYLQHNSDNVEVYEEGHWNFVRGQLQTIDRTFGLGIDSMLHHITDGHVAHHFFFTRIPHYHLMEATDAIKTTLAPYDGAYKTRSCFAFVIEFLSLNVRLEYLVGKGTGILKYAKKTKPE